MKSCPSSPQLDARTTSPGASFTGVDPASRRDLWDLINDLVDDGTSVVLTTQYLDEADQLADRIAVIDHGRLISEGTADQLKSRVGGAVLELSVTDSYREAALVALDAMGAVAPASDPDRGKIVVPAGDGVPTLRAAMSRLDVVKITPTDVGLRKPTLDDVSLPSSITKPAGRRTASPLAYAPNSMEGPADERFRQSRSAPRAGGYSHGHHHQAQPPGQCPQA